MYDPDSLEEVEEVSLKDKLTLKWIQFKLWLENLIKR